VHRGWEIHQKEKYCVPVYDLLKESGTTGTAHEDVALATRRPDDFLPSFAAPNSVVSKWAKRSSTIINNRL